MPKLELKKIYLKFELVGKSSSGKTRIYSVVSRELGISLGNISWHGPWRQYVFHPLPNTFFNNGCLNEVSNYLEHLNTHHRGQHRN
jgi:hypothetical protein